MFVCFSSSCSGAVDDDNQVGETDDDVGDDVLWHKSRFLCTIYILNTLFPTTTTETSPIAV